VDDGLTICSGNALGSFEVSAAAGAEALLGSFLDSSDSNDPSGLNGDRASISRQAEQRRGKEGGKSDGAGNSVGHDSSGDSSDDGGRCDAMLVGAKSPLQAELAVAERLHSHAEPMRGDTTADRTSVDNDVPEKVAVGEGVEAIHPGLAELIEPAPFPVSSPSEPLSLETALARRPRAKAARALPPAVLEPMLLPPAHARTPPAADDDNDDDDTETNGGQPSPRTPTKALSPTQDAVAASFLATAAAAAPPQLLPDSPSYFWEEEADGAAAAARAEMAQYATVLGATSAFERNRGPALQKLSPYHPFSELPSASSPPPDETAVSLPGGPPAPGYDRADEEVSVGDDNADEEDFDPMVALLAGGYSLGYDAVRQQQARKLHSVQAAQSRSSQALLDGVAGPLGASSAASRHAGTAAAAAWRALPEPYRAPLLRAPLPLPPARSLPPLPNAKNAAGDAVWTEAGAATGADAADAADAAAGSFTDAEEDGAGAEAQETSPEELAAHFAEVLGEGVNVTAALVEPDSGTGELGVHVQEVTVVLAARSIGDDGSSKDGPTPQQLVVYDAAAVEEYYARAEARAIKAAAAAEEELEEGELEEELPEAVYAVDLEEVLFVLEGHQTPALEPFRTLRADEGESALAVPADRCCSLVGLDFSLDLICADVTERSALVAGLSALLGFRSDGGGGGRAGSSGGGSGRVLSRMDPGSGAGPAGGAATALAAVVLQGLRAALGLPDDEANDGPAADAAQAAARATKGKRGKGPSSKGLGQPMGGDDGGGGDHDDDGGGDHAEGASQGHASGGGGSDDGTASTVSGATTVASAKAAARQRRLADAAASRNGSSKVGGDALSDEDDGVASTASAATTVVSANAAARRRRLAAASTSKAAALTAREELNDRYGAPQSPGGGGTGGPKPKALAEDAIGALVQQLEAATMGPLGSEGTGSEHGSGHQGLRARSLGLG
jgi:hypothetical protein